MVLYVFDPEGGRRWSAQVGGRPPVFACLLGFTETCLIPGISAAGATPEARRYTAIGDGEMLLSGDSARLPTAPQGYPSPVVIAKAAIALMQLPVYVFDAGLPEPCAGAIPLGGAPARCLSGANALPLATVNRLIEAGLLWGERLAALGRPLALGECVAGGTTTALAVLRALGIAADGLVNSSHPQCNHEQKRRLVDTALANYGERPALRRVLAAFADPMQPALAAMAMAASRTVPVLLCGGTQMLAVAAIASRLASEEGIAWESERVAVGTTRWVAADPTASAAQLAAQVGCLPLLASELHFAASRHAGLRAYENGYVKEGVGAGGLAIWAELVGISPAKLAEAVDALLDSLLIPSQRGLSPDVAMLDG